MLRGMPVQVQFKCNVALDSAVQAMTPLHHQGKLAINTQQNAGGELSNSSTVSQLLCLWP